MQGGKTLGQGSANVAMGNATRQTARLSMVYAPSTPTHATLVLSARDGCGTDGQRLAVTVLPPRRAAGSPSAGAAAVNRVALALPAQARPT